MLLLARTDRRSVDGVRRRVFGSFLLLLLLSGCLGGDERARPVREREPAASEPKLTTRVARELAAQLDQKVKDLGVPGASAAVVFPGGQVWKGAAGVAVLKPERPMTSHTSLPFASITKMATAALSMRLVEQGRLNLDDPIDRWYSSWRGDSGATVRDLLGHTAGVGEPPDEFFERFGIRGAPTTRQYIAATPKPGHRTSAAEYSSTGFMIAGLILAKAGGRPIAAAMRQQLFAPSRRRGPRLSGGGTSAPAACSRLLVSRRNSRAASMPAMAAGCCQTGPRRRWLPRRARSRGTCRRWHGGRTSCSAARSSNVSPCVR